MKLIYLHGFKGSPESQKVQDLQEMFPNSEVIAPDYQPHNPSVAEATLDKLFYELGSAEEIMVVGTSLGGFWARWCASEYGVKSLCVNPQFRPWDIPVGTYKTYGSIPTEIEFTLGMQGQLRNYVTNKGFFVIALAMDDDVIDSKKTAAFYSRGRNKRPVLEWSTGGHRFTDFKRVKSVLVWMRNTYCL